MKANVMFDTLAYANKLKAAGVDPKAAEVQAEANAEMVATLLENTLVTKKDLAEVRIALNQDIAEVRAELKQDIAEVRAELKQDIAQLETRLTLRLGGIMVGTMTVATTILSVLHFAH